MLFALRGSESLFIGLNHLDTFGAVGAFSSGLREGFEGLFPALTSSATAHLRTFWIGRGTSDRLVGINRKFKSWLSSNQ